MGKRKKPEDELTLEELAKELDTYSAQISLQLRTVNLGTLGLTWLLLLKKDELSALASKISERALLGVALGCLVALLLDFLQYLLAEKVVDEAFDRAAASPAKTSLYDESSVAYRTQLWCYRAKLFITFASALCLVVLIARALF